MTATWRDVIRFDQSMTAPLVEIATRALDKADPYLNLGRLATEPATITVSWWTPPPNTPANWNGLTSYTDVLLNANALSPGTDGGWEETLIHEMVHVIDKHCWDDTVRARIMAYFTREDGQPNVWLDASTPYAYRSGEAIAELTARHIWYGTAGDLAFSAGVHWNPAEDDQIIALVALTGGSSPVGLAQPKPAPARRFRMLIFAEGLDATTALAVAGTRRVGVATTSLAEAQAAIARGEQVVVVGGPAATALGHTPSAGSLVVDGNVTYAVGTDANDSLTLALEAIK